MKLWNKIVTELKVEYYEKFCGLENTYVESFGTGKLKSIVQRGTENRTMIVTLFISNGTIHLTSIVIGLGFLIYNGPWTLFPLLVIVFIIYGRLGLKSEKLLRSYKNSRRDESLKRDRIATTILMTKQEILQSNLRERLQKRLREITENIIKIHHESSLKRILINDPLNFLADIIKIPLLAWAGFQVLNGTMSVEEFLLIALSINIINKGFGRINQLIKDYAVCTNSGIS